MTHTVFVVIYLVIMGALIITIDVAFLSERFWLRLAVNIAIVAVFGTCYYFFFKNLFT